MAFLGKVFFFFNLFSQSATLPVYLFVSLFVNLHFSSYYFSALNIFQGFGRIQNMDPRSMDHPFGPGPWTTSFDPVHGPPLLTQFLNIFHVSNTGLLKLTESL